MHHRLDVWRFSPNSNELTCKAISLLSLRAIERNMLYLRLSSEKGDRMNTKALRTTAALLVVMALGLIGAAQETEMLLPVSSPWTVTGGVQMFFPAMTELNEQIGLFNLDIKDVRSSLVSLYGESMTLDGWVSPVTASTGKFARLLYGLSPSLGVGFEAEYVSLTHHGGYSIYSLDKGVSLRVRLSAPAGGVLGVLCFDSADLIDLEPWSFRLTAGTGYYNATAKMEKQIQLTGIDEFTLRDEAYVTDGASAWGSKLRAIIRHQFADALALEFSAGWRSLKFEQVAVNFNDPTDKIDLDFSGLCLSFGIVLGF